MKKWKKNTLIISLYLYLVTTAINVLGLWFCQWVVFFPFVNHIAVDLPIAIVFNGLSPLLLILTPMNIILILLACIGVQTNKTVLPVFGIVVFVVDWLFALLILISNLLNGWTGDSMLSSMVFDLVSHVLVIILLTQSINFILFTFLLHI